MMVPETQEMVRRRVKERIAPNAEESCKHCGLYGVKLIEGWNETFQCAIDSRHRYCQGRCPRYEEKFSSKLKRWLFGSE